MATDLPRPAFYALAPGGWRDYLTLLHPPYTAWHLSYVVVGAALAPELSVSTLIATLAAFFFAVGLGAHALDELNGRPLRTRIPSAILVVLAVIGVGGAAAIGILGAVSSDPWLGLFIAAGVFLVCAYNLELAAGRFHSDAWFALAWGAFPVLTAYFAQSGRIDAAAVLGAVFATAMSAAQRHLSSQVRDVRRRVTLPERADRAARRRLGAADARDADRAGRASPALADGRLPRARCRAPYHAGHVIAADTTPAAPVQAPPAIIAPAPNQVSFGRFVVRLPAGTRAGSSSSSAATARPRGRRAEGATRSGCPSPRAT